MQPNKFTLSKYKHDVTGKLGSIIEAVAHLDSESFESEDTYETLLAIHDSLLKLTFKSAECLRHRTSHKTSLEFLETRKDDLTNITIDGFDIGYILESDRLVYYVQNSSALDKENSYNFLSTLLPLFKRPL